jgi:hypothetical protein
MRGSLRFRAVALAIEKDERVKKGTVVWSCIRLVAVLVMSTMFLPSAAVADDLLQILQGYEIAPVHLNRAGKDWALVGLGSYLVNTTGCNDCHTHPNWAPGGNPYLGQPEQINTAEYLTGGRIFGPVTSPIAISANITPDKTGKPAGLSLAEFLSVMRTGHDPDVPGRLLQVMPWPLYRWKTERDLIAMYEYLRAIPSLPDNSQPGP